MLAALLLNAQTHEMCGQTAKNIPHFFVLQQSLVDLRLLNIEAT